MTVECRACGRATSAFLCAPCSATLERALGDLPGLVDDIATSAVKQTRVYRATGRTREPDQDWRGATHALPPHPMPVDLDAATLLRATGNTLTTWARHLAETRGVPLNLSTGRATEGPVCAAHVHDFTVDGCGIDPASCKQLHPDHVHDYSRKGCGHDRDPETGALTCTKLHCDHDSCRSIRYGEFTGSAAALVRWFLHNRNSLRYDEAAGELHDEITALHAELAKAVDRTPSPFYAGPCHAEVTEPVTTERDGTIYIEVTTHRCERDLYAWPGTDEITCNGYRGDEQGCGAVHSPADRHEWLVAAAEDALLSIEEMTAVLPSLFKAYPQPPKSVMHAWVRQGRLAAHGLNHAGQPTFRGGDLLGLVEAYKPHKYAPRPNRRTA